MPDAGKKIDWLIVTAANRRQARGYHAQLAARRGSRLLRRVGQTLVVPDVGDRRIGSGASTLVALERVATHLVRSGKQARNPAELLRGARIVIIHCGGDSRRLPAYAAQGKVFLPLPYETEPGEHASLFDLILADLLSLDISEAGGVVIASGDVFLDLAPHAIDLTQAEFTGVAWRTDYERGSRHGVYVLNERGCVTNFLQKPTREEAQRAGALDESGQVLIDTGILALAAQAAAHWLDLAGVHAEAGRLVREPGLIADLLARKERHLDLYQGMLALGTQREERKEWLAGHSFRAEIVPDCAFLHLGSSRELLDRLVRDEETRRRHKFKQHLRCSGVEGSGLEGATICNTLVASQGNSAGAAALLEGCHLRAQVRLDGENILVGVPGGLTAPIELPWRTGLVCLPVGDGDDWAAVCFGMGDDCKGPRTRGGTFLNEPLDALVERAGSAPGSLWDDAEPDAQTLWSARLWPVGRIDAVVGSACALVAANPVSSALPAGRRSNLAELMARVSHRRLLAHLRYLADEIERARTP